MLYTHNSVGLGHAVRCLAVLTGLRHHRPDLDFLVLTGSMVPQLFLDEGLEVIKLPGLRQDLEAARPSFTPRLLSSLDAPGLARMRSRIIVAAMEEFRPDAIMVEHYPAGLLDELRPVLEMKSGPAGAGFVLVHLSRGDPVGPPGMVQGGRERDGLAGLFDFIYVLDDPPTADGNPGTDAWSARRRFLGPVTVRRRVELPGREAVLARLDWPAGRRLVLICLGRGGPVADMAGAVLDALPQAGFDGREALVVLDPYLDRTQASRVAAAAGNRGARCRSFLPGLVDVVAVADLVVCRAGYNAVAELLMTGARGLVIPERHPSGEQERRAGRLAAENLVVAGEEEILSGRAAERLVQAAGLPAGPGRDDFDKRAVGARLAADLEAWLAGRRGGGGPCPG